MPDPTDPRPCSVPPPLDPVSPGDAESEFGVPRGHQARLARDGVPPEDGGPYRPLTPGEGRRDGRQVRRHGGERLRG